jgi:anhydro-N-acetylmuramic acid kinase
MKSQIRVMGIMNGTSLDGVDFVLTGVKKQPLKTSFISHVSCQFPVALKEKLRRATNHELKVADLSRLHHELGRFYSDQVIQLGLKKKWKFDLIGLHGQTVFHEGGQSTLQIGEASYLSGSTDTPVVADFRAADLAVGGQGAPLATFFHLVAFQDQIKNGPISVHNLGGISNVSYFPKGSVSGFLKGSQKGIMSFDTGPANMIIDLMAQKLSSGKKTHDENGDWAASGIIHHELIQDWLTHPFLKKTPPKSCGREEFGNVFLDLISRQLKNLSEKDQMATVTEFTAQSISEAYRKFLPNPPKLSIFAGGGALNSHLMFRIRYNLPDIEVVTSAELGWPNSSIEGGAFGLMAACRLWEIPAHLPSTTGASRKALLGKVVEL